MLDRLIIQMICTVESPNRFSDFSIHFSLVINLVCIERVGVPSATHAVSCSTAVDITFKFTHRIAKNG